MRDKLPRYVKPKLVKSSGEIAYHFTPPTWARRNETCPVSQENLGTDRTAAFERANLVLLPLLDKWRTGGKAEKEEKNKPVFGTLDWVFYTVYKKDRLFAVRQKDGKPRASRQKRNDELGMKMISKFVMKDGRLLGTVHTKFVNTVVVDSLYEKLLIKPSGGERRTTANHAMKTARRAWKIAQRRHPSVMPKVNPFEKMGLSSSSKDTRAATFDELMTYRAKAHELGWHSLATGALLGYELQVRVQDIYGTFAVEHYRPKDHPDEICLIDEKTDQLSWRSLFDPDTGGALYPELMAELDAIKRDRISGFMFVRDQAEKAKKKGLPWPTWPDGPEGDPDLTHCSRIVRQVMSAAGLTGLTATCFRHGGATEGGNSGLTEKEQIAQGRWKSAKVLPRYVKTQDQQAINGAKKRRQYREKKQNGSGAKVANLSDRRLSALSDRNR